MAVVPEKTDLSPDESLLSPETLARINRLILLSRQMPKTRQKGRRRSYQIGHGTERIDTRSYVPGDDPRRIAWTIYGRLERLVTWIVAEEEPLRVNLIIDTSGSMGFGKPSKLRQSTRIAAGFAAIALSNEDRVATVATSLDPPKALRSLTGRKALPKILALLNELKPNGETDLAAISPAVNAYSGGRGLCIIFSDFFDPKGSLQGAQALRDQGHEVALIEVLDPLEVDPPDLDGLVLEDEESGERVELSEAGARKKYQKALENHWKQLEAGAFELGAPLIHVTTTQPFDDIVAQALQSAVLRS